MTQKCRETCSRAEPEPQTPTDASDDDAPASGLKGFRDAACLFTCADSPCAVGSRVPGGVHAARWRRSVRGVVDCFWEIDLSDHLSRGGPGLPPQSCHLTHTEKPRLKSYRVHFSIHRVSPVLLHPHLCRSVAVAHLLCLSPQNQLLLPFLSFQ